MTKAAAKLSPGHGRSSPGQAVGERDADIVALVKRARDARSIRSKKAVLDAATALYLDVGHFDFSINAVVQATGIARSTIYRHWPTQIHLLTAVVARLLEQFEIPDRGDLRTDLIEYHLVRAHGVFDTPHQRAFQTLPGLLHAANREPGIINLINYVIGKFLEALRVMVARAQDRGELKPGCDTENVVRIIYGAMSARSLLNEQHSDAQIIAMIDILLDGFRTPPS